MTSMADLGQIEEPRLGREHWHPDALLREAELEDPSVAPIRDPHAIAVKIDRDALQRRGVERERLREGGCMVSVTCGAQMAALGREKRHESTVKGHGLYAAASGRSEGDASQ